MEIEDNLFCKYRSGVMAFWIGFFPNPDDFWKYIQTWFCIHDENDYDERYNLKKDDFDQKLSRLWRKENKGRVCEAFFHDLFEDSHFNQMEYDFGVGFDEDFQIAHSCISPTTDFKEFLGEWEPDFLTDLKNLFPKGRLPRAYNCFFGIPSCQYIGALKEIENEYGRMIFIGNIEETTYSTDIAEKYNR